MQQPLPQTTFCDYAVKATELNYAILLRSGKLNKNNLLGVTQAFQKYIVFQFLSLD